MSQSASKQLCPECGLELPTGAGGFGCPGCSLRLALSPETAASTPPLPPGLRSRFFGNYEILDEIARGGMGVVYRARQLGLNRLVALKMVQSHHLLSDEARLRFRVEIEAVAQLHHPHIVSLYESGEEDGAHYFTMSLVEGGDLAADLKRERPRRQRIAMLVKVCRAIHYAHQRGILHRDLKPSNILLDGQGEPQVADFGLAKSLDQDSGFTFASSVLGSPNYMAPEQAAGKNRQLTTAVDVYGLGAILYHMLAGQPPFQAKTPIETLRQVMDHDPPPPRTFSPQVDTDLETIALKCLRKEPNARYSSAEDLAKDLERWLEGRPILARSLGPLARAWRWSRRHPVAAGLGAALALALATIVIGTIMTAARIRQADQKSAASLRESLLREASSLRLNSEMGQRDKGLRLIREAVALGGSSEFRMRARNELLATLVRTEPTFEATGSTNVAAKPELNAVHPALQLVASVENETNVVFRTIEDGAFRMRLACPDGPITRITSFSRDGRFLALHQGHRLSVWDLNTRRQCLSLAGTNISVAFHPREDSIVIEPTPYEAMWLELPSGHERHRWQADDSRLKGGPSGWQLLALSPDGRLLAGVGAGTRLIEFLDPMTGEQLRLITNNVGPTSIRWNAKGNSLAVAATDGRVSFWNPVTGALQWSSPPMIAPAYSLAFHPHRDWLAAGCGDGKVRIIDTHQKQFVFEYPAESRLLTFSPLGTRLGPVWSEGQLGWLHTSRASAFISFGVGRSDPLKGGSFSADGKLLNVGNATRVVICDPYPGRVVTTRNDWLNWTCAYHPQENHLLTRDRQGIWRSGYHLADLRLTLSPRRLIHPGAEWGAFGFAPDGRHFAAFNGESNSVVVFDQTLTNRVAALPLQTKADMLALSPEGRWLTVGIISNLVAQLWDVPGEKLIFSLPANDPPQCVFSGDGRWLAVSGSRFRQLHVGTWTPAPPLPIRESRPILGAAAFSPDSRVLALVVNRFEVHLFDLLTFEFLGILRPPGTIQILALVYSPDGSQLAALGAEGRVAIWNLQEVEQNLIEFGLGWEKSSARSSGSVPR